MFMVEAVKHFLRRTKMFMIFRSYEGSEPYFLFFREATWQQHTEIVDFNVIKWT